MTVIDVHELTDPVLAAEHRSLSSVSKALTILDAFQGAASVLGVTEIARRTGFPKSTAFRLLSSLEELGYIERRGSDYCLGRRLFELGNEVSWCRPSNLRDTALPFMCELFLHLQQVVHLAVLQGTDVLYLEKLHGHDRLASPSRVGGRVSARTTALGKAILAFSPTSVIHKALTVAPALRTGYTILHPQLFLEELDDVRRKGVSFDREEVRIGLTCVAAPILLRGEPLGAISASGRTGAFDPVAAAARVKAVADAIAKRMGA